MWKGGGQKSEEIVDSGGGRGQKREESVDSGRGDPKPKIKRGIICERPLEDFFMLFFVERILAWS